MDVACRLAARLAVHLATANHVAGGRKSIFTFIYHRNAKIE